MKRIRLAHVFSYFHTLGGVEAVLRHHHEHDAKHGFDSDFIIYFETDARRTERVHFLDLDSNRSSIALGRKRFGNAIREIRPEVVLYHGLWGVPFLADLDGAKRRAVVVHGEVPRVREMLIDRERWMDGFACIRQTPPPPPRVCVCARGGAGARVCGARARVAAAGLGFFFFFWSKSLERPCLHFRKLESSF